MEQITFPGGRTESANSRDGASLASLARAGRLGALTHLTAHGVVVAALAAVSGRPLSVIHVSDFRAPVDFGALVGPQTQLSLRLFHVLTVEVQPGRVKLDVDEWGDADEAQLAALLAWLIKPDDEVQLSIDARAEDLGHRVRALVLSVPHRRIVAPPQMVRH